MLGERDRVICSCKYGNEKTFELLTIYQRGRRTDEMKSEWKGRQKDWQRGK